MKLLKQLLQLLLIMMSFIGLFLINISFLKVPQFQKLIVFINQLFNSQKTGQTVFFVLFFLIPLVIILKLIQRIFEGGFSRNYEQTYYLQKEKKYSYSMSKLKSYSNDKKVIYCSILYKPHDLTSIPKKLIDMHEEMIRDAKNVYNIPISFEKNDKFFFPYHFAIIIPASSKIRKKQLYNFISAKILKYMCEFDN